MGVNYYVTVICDNCGKTTEEDEAKGWFQVRDARKSWTQNLFCSIECFTNKPGKNNLKA